jgi:hypothetical protein
MALGYYITKPQAEALMVWDGSNLSEIEGFVYPGVTITDNLDGTLTTDASFSNIIRLGNALTLLGTEIDVINGHQEVESIAPISYVVTED